MKKKVKIMYFVRSARIPIDVTSVFEVDDKEFATFFDEKLIGCTFFSDYFIIKRYASLVS